MARFVPLDRCLIETDSPYLAPVPYRGKTNQPAYVPFVAEQLAELKGCSLQQVAEATSANFEQLFTRTRQADMRARSMFMNNIKLLIYLFVITAFSTARPTPIPTSSAPSTSTTPAPWPSCWPRASTRTR